MLLRKSQFQSLRNRNMYIVNPNPISKLHVHAIVKHNAFSIVYLTSIMVSSSILNFLLSNPHNRMQRVISAVRTALSDLKLAIDGTIIMSEDLRDALDSMFDAKIPKTWQKVRALSFRFSTTRQRIAALMVTTKWLLRLLGDERASKVEFAFFYLTICVTFLLEP